MSVDGLKKWRLKRRWNKQGRKDFFTWVHRYLRLHAELLDDIVYQDMFAYFRATLVAYLKKELKLKNMNDEQLGEMVDDFADIFNKASAERVNAYKPVVDELYKNWRLTSEPKIIRV